MQNQIAFFILFVYISFHQWAQTRTITLQMIILRSAYALSMHCQKWWIIPDSSAGTSILQLFKANCLLLHGYLPNLKSIFMKFFFIG